MRSLDYAKTHVRVVARPGIVRISHAPDFGVCVICTIQDDLSRELVSLRESSEALVETGEGCEMCVVAYMEMPWQVVYVKMVVDAVECMGVVWVDKSQTWLDWHVDMGDGEDFV